MRLNTRTAANLTLPTASSLPANENTTVTGCMSGHPGQGVRSYSFSPPAKAGLGRPSSECHCGTARIVPLLGPLPRTLPAYQGSPFSQPSTTEDVD
ncbi:hypothetical protein LZ30DRAFT_704548 [Colletotrichum cereale]|nr:hypothetical protein LZ30DRAFT_704548 [Colletotrichum cereale]